MTNVRVTNRNNQVAEGLTVSIGLQAVGEEAISGQMIMDPLEVSISIVFPWLVLEYDVLSFNQKTVTQHWPDENTPQVFNGTLIV